MDILKTPKVRQSSTSKAPLQKFTTSIFCLFLAGLTIFSGLSGNQGLIPLLIFASALYFAQPYLNDKQNTKKAKKELILTLGVLSTGFYQLVNIPLYIQFLNGLKRMFMGN